MKHLAAPILAQEKRRLKLVLDGEYQQRLRQREDILRRKASQSARAEVRREVASLRAEAAAAQRRLEDASRSHEADLRRIRKEAQQNSRQDREREISRMEKEAERREQQAARSATRKFEARVQAAEAKREKERARYEIETSRLQRQVEDLSRRLEKTQSEQLGEEAEVDLFAKLRAAFPQDRIERVGKGRKGADLLHRIMVGSKEAGRIVYESKNVSTWQNAFISKAKQYQRQYNTPYIVVATRALPRRQKGLCVVGGIPVVEPHMAVPLAVIVREAVVEIGQMRLSSQCRGLKAQRLFEYIIGDEFRARFRGIAEAVTELRDQQDRERDWHEGAWDKRTDLHDRIETCRREVAAKVKTITSTSPAARPRLRVVSAIA
jgi:hypothetical protein